MGYNTGLDEATKIKKLKAQEKKRKWLIPLLLIILMAVLFKTVVLKLIIGLVLVAGLALLIVLLIGGDLYYE